MKKRTQNYIFIENMELDSQTKSLIVSAKLGNKEALNHLFARYQSRVLRVVRLRLTPDLRHKLGLQSMDILQEVFMYAFKHLKDFEPKSQGHFLNWLSKKVQHYIYDRLDYISREKRKAPQGKISIEQEFIPKGETSKMKIQLKDKGPTPYQIAVIKEKKEIIDSLLDLLEPEQKEIIINRDLEELTFKEIGKLYDKSEDAVRKQYTRAFKKLIELSEEKLKPLIAELTYKEYKDGF